MKGYPHGFGHLLWGCLGALIISGLLLTPSLLQMRLDWELPEFLVLGRRTWFAAAHALFGFLFLGFLGALSSLHVRSGWRRRRNVRTGITLLASSAVLALTALGIYYLGDAQWATLAAVIHLALGVVVPFPMGLHYLRRKAIPKSGKA